MKLVSAAKLRRAQDAAQGGRAYGQYLGRIVRTLINDLGGDFTHPLVTAPREIRRRRVVVIAADRGLCGAYNANIIKSVQANEFGRGVDVDFVTVGRRAISAGNRFGWTMIREFESPGENAAQWPIEEIAAAITTDFAEGNIDEVVVYYTQFVSAMTQRVVREIVLPFQVTTNTTSPATSPADLSAGASERSAGYFSYEPSPEKILSGLIPLLIRTQLLQAGLEAKASEHAARMTAMDAATSNADDLIDRLRLFYNRARQSAITRELIDIVGGAEAQK